MDYLRDPAAIYRESFATIRAEANLAHLPAALHPVAVRMIHACGMVDLAEDIIGDPGIVEAVRLALDAGAPVLCDSEMVKAGLMEKRLRSNAVVVTLDAPGVPERAVAHGTTRSAAAVDNWVPILGHSVVVIGNAPTALFRLIEMLASIPPGGPYITPAAIIAMPVGFVGAAESKARLVEQVPAPFITVRGRRGGSAIAAAAFNALAGAAE